MRYTMILQSGSGSETLVSLERETAKAILVRGGCSSAWFPKSAISEDGEIASWFQFTLSHIFLFQEPYSGAQDFFNLKEGRTQC